MVPRYFSTRTMYVVHRAFITILYVFTGSECLDILDYDPVISIHPAPVLNTTTQIPLGDMLI